MKDYLFEIIDEDSDACGEQFFVECESLREARKIVHENFPDVTLKFCGLCSVEEAEILDYDTY